MTNKSTKTIISLTIKSTAAATTTQKTTTPSAATAVAKTTSKTQMLAAVVVATALISKATKVTPSMYQIIRILSSSIFLANSISIT